MTRALRNRVIRLERALRDPSEADEIDLIPISDEELDQALSVPWSGGVGGQVSAIEMLIPRSPEAARAVEQAAQIYEHAMNVDRYLVGFQRDQDLYLEAALPVMFAEPRREVVQAMLDAIRTVGLPLLTTHIVHAINGRMAPDGWRPAE